MTAVRWRRLAQTILLLVCALSSRPFGSMEQRTTAGGEITQPAAMVSGVRLAQSSLGHGRADDWLDSDYAIITPAFCPTTLARASASAAANTRDFPHDTMSCIPATLSIPPPPYSS